MTGKITELDPTITPVDADLIEIVQDVATTPVNKKITWASIKTSLASIFIPNSLVDAKGDLIVASADNTPARLAVGSDGEIPRAKSSATTGIEWTPPYNSLAYQCLINGGFTVNQRVYVSDATLAAGAYGHDRWKAGASGGDYTFTQLAQATTITIKTGKSLIQVVEDKNVIGGTYTLSWTGTAQARFGKDSATPSGSYAASPLTITGQTAGTVMSVEFNEGTLGKVNLANSSVALPFMPKSYEEELRACQRYAIDLCGGGTVAYIPIANVFAESTTRAAGIIQLPQQMRIVPSLESLTASNFSVGYPGTTACTSVALDATANNKKAVRIVAQVASGLTQSFLYTLHRLATSGVLILSAEL